MEHPGPRTARRGTLGQFRQIGLESRTDCGTQVTESRLSGSQGDPTSEPRVEKRGETVQTGGEKSLETRPETDQTHRETRQEKKDSRPPNALSNEPSNGLPKKPSQPEWLERPRP